MKFNCVSYLCLLTVFVSIAPLAGCGDRGDRPELGLVEGVVTLEGKPIANARVVFEPLTGRESLGVTNEDGHYELIYIRDIKGAVVGPHTVRITMATDKAPKEQISPQYNRRTELEREVQSSRNRFDFELGSKSAKRK